MRGRDLFRLALAALWQSKGRTLLTLAGVALGTGMLVVSLSLGQGLRHVVETEFRKNGQLRSIVVSRSWQTPPIDEAAIPPNEIEVRGEVSDERRQRLRQLLIGRYRQRQPRRSMPLDLDRLAAIANVPHVAAVVPQVYVRADVDIHGSPRGATMALLSPLLANVEQHLVCGRLPAPDQPEMMVSESILLTWGIIADADVKQFLGSPLHLEFKDEQPYAPRALLNVLGANSSGAGPSPDELRVLSDVADNLPAMIAQLDLPPAQAAVLKSLLGRSKSIRPPENRPTKVAGDFTVVGVYHHGRAGAADGWALGQMGGDLLVSARPGQELLAQLPLFIEHGFAGARVTVDREDHVRGVLNKLDGMGFETQSVVEWAERAMREVTLIGLGMTVLSVLALVVAGLGITNTMVTSVLERTHDIGIMKAVGARDRQVLGLFLIEGVTLGLLGGGLGLLGAWLFSLSAEEWIRRVMEEQSQQKITYPIFRFPAWLLAGSPLFAVLVTTAAALLPARRAARIDPAVTLRTE